MPICLVVFIGLVAASGLVAGVPIGALGVNTTVSMGVSADQNGTAGTPVYQSTPVVQLSVSPVLIDEEPILLCTGNVTVDGRPAAGALVHLTFDDYGIHDCTTGEDGAFSLWVRIEPGRHSVVANVTFVDRPESTAQSARVMAEIPGELPLLFLATTGIALLAGGTGLFFWRRGRRTERQPEPEVEVPLPSEEPTPVSVTDDLLETARTLAAGELRTGIEAVYGEFLVRLDRQQPGARLRTRTPREIREQFEGTPIAAPVTAMTTIYEAVVYSGRTPVEKDRRAMIDLFVAVFSGSERADR